MKKSLNANKISDTILKNIDFFKNYLEEVIRLEMRDKRIPRQSKTSHSNLLEQYRQISRNRNYWISSSNPKETEITNEVPHVGETPESRFAAESQPLAATSLTSSATFVEYLFPPQLASVRDTAKAHLSSSPIQLYFRSVPAVHRRLVDRESRFAQSGKDHKHGSFCVTTVSDAVNLTDKDCSGVQEICPVELCTEGYLSLLDCCDNQRITIVNHDFADYARLGNVPEGLRQVISDQVTVSDINYNNFVPAIGQSSGLQENMATSDEDPRLINKFSRTPGRNISKLKKFFDSCEGVSSNSDTSCSKIEESSSNTSHSLHASNDQQDMEFQSDSSKHVSNVNTESESTSNLNQVLETESNESTSNETVVKVSSDVPYCRKVSSGGDLWKNVDIGVNSSSDGLWTSSQNDDNTDDSHYNHVDFRQISNSFVSSTADLHNLIAASRVELSKKKEPELSDKSTLENYFTSFENSKPKKFVPLSSVDHSIFTTDTADFQISDNETYKSSVTSSYDCDVDEMNFEDEEVTLSDTSSDEDIRCTNPPINTHYLPAYALHTIIEESCEESEQDSRGATPTNEPVTSKLERYFSWDIINDTETDLKRKEDDDSTIYSDSLSEVSGSLNGDANKEIDPTQLASSRLEKYFTSGLVGNENYFYPDDAEFLEDAPVSDFEEDSIHQKISRSALLSSLETVCEQQAADSNELHDEELSSTYNHSSENHDVPITNENDDLVSTDTPKTNENSSELDSPQINNELEIDNSQLNDCESKSELKTEEIDLPKPEVYNLDLTDSSNVSSDVVINNLQQLELESEQSEITENVINVNIDDDLTQKQTVNKEQLAIDVQAIIKKLLIYFSGTGSNSFKHNMESDYTSAWTILETEIERLIQSISPTSSLENNSCNSSTIDSNNSDYGSDTIESLDCMTDEDEATDSKSRSSAKYPIVDLFNSAYKKQAGHDFHNFNISDETLSIWKRLIQSLQKDSFCMNDNKLYDPNTEARLYIRDQIVNLMHTVTVSENKVDKIDESVLSYQEKEIESSFIEESNAPEDINEAYNVSISGSNVITCLSEEDNIVVTTKTEVSNEEISIENSRNSEILKDDDKTGNNELIVTDSDVDIESDSSKDLNKSLTENSSDSDEKDTLPNNHQISEKINVDEVDVKLGNNSIRKLKSSDNSANFSVFVNIELGDDQPSVTEEKSEVSNKIKDLKKEQEESQRTSVHLWVSGDSETIEKDIDVSDHVDITNLPLPAESSPNACQLSDSKIPEKSYRDTGYYSFKSSDDSLLNDTPPPDEFMDVPNFKSLKRSVKKFPLTNTLSKSTNNINQIFSISDTKFSTLQLKSHKSKGSNSNNSPSRQFTSLFSPTAVFKKLTGSKNNDAQTSESSIPPKYLKKYARSSSVDSETMLGAISMPQLNPPKPGDSYSALGLYSENDRDSSLIVDDDLDVKRHSAYSHSVLSLGAHSASMTSVYSASACHYGYVTVTGDVLFGLNYNQKSQMMEVFVKQCRNLAAVDIRRNKSDPYVKVYLLPDKTKSGKRKTKTKKSTLNPVFNELLRFPVLKHELESRTLWLSVWNSDLFGRNDFLGEITLPLGYRLLDSPTLRWYPLQERMESLTSPLNYKGELFLALKYVPRDLSLESRFRPAPVISLRGALHVLVKEARNISINGSGSNLDAFCKSYLLPDKSKSSKQKTPVVKKSRHPKWYYTMIYEDLSVDELKERSLELTVWDHDKITSNEFMGGVRLNLGSGLYHGVPVEWMDARRDEVNLWQAMLQSPNMWVDGCLPLRPTMQFHHG